MDTYIRRYIRVYVHDTHAYFPTLGAQAVQVGRKYGVEGTAFEPGTAVAGAFRRAGQDLSDSASNNALGLIHKVFGTTFAQPKKRTGVQIVGSAYNPKLAIEKDRYENLFHHAEYGIAALFHLPGAEKRTWVDNHTIKNFV